MFSFALSSKSPTQAARGSFVHLERPAAIPLKIGWGCLPSRSPPRGGKSHLGFHTGFLLWHSQPHDFVTLTVIPASTCDASLCLGALAYLLNSCVCPSEWCGRCWGGRALRNGHSLWAGPSTQMCPRLHAHPVGVLLCAAEHSRAVFVLDPRSV